MTKYLVTHEAVIGRTKEEGAALPPITLTFYSMVEASTTEEANEKIVTYRDPGFSTRIVSIAEVADILSADDLYALLAHDKVLAATN